MGGARVVSQGEELFIDVVLSYNGVHRGRYVRPVPTLWQEVTLCLG